MADRETRQKLIEKGCWLCGRALGKRIQFHHTVPKSRGGNETVPVHPICHNTLHATLTNRQLDDIGTDVQLLRANQDLAEFLRWIDAKPADFHAPTRRRKS